MATFTTADRIGAIGGYIGGISSLLGGMNNGCGNGNGLLGNLLGNNGCNNNCYVTEKELGYIMAGQAKDSKIAELEADRYTDNKIAVLNDKWQARYDALNEKVENKFDYLLQKETKLEGDLAMECERRACGDENIVNYVNGNFIKADKYLNSNHVKYGACQPVLKACNPCGPTTGSEADK